MWTNGSSKGRYQGQYFTKVSMHRFASLLLALFITLGWSPLFAETAVASKTVRLLTVGNSFSHNATHCLSDLARAGGDKLVLKEDNVGGASMELHWSKVEAFEKDPADQLGKYASGKSLKEDLTSGPWDFITIQQASVKSHDLATYRPYARQLSDYIRKYAAGATLLLHETWEYRVDDPRFLMKEPKPGEPKSQEDMYQGLSEAYAAIAKELGVRRLPVGDAFHAANRDPKWGFVPSKTRFDSKNAKPGELPDQTHSLNVGWNWKKKAGGPDTLIMDGHHASMAGEYLGACVWYEVMFGKNVVGNTYVPAGLDPEYAGFLRQTAHRAVAQAASE
jgi:hypothetical protein